VLWFKSPWDTAFCIQTKNSKRETRARYIVTLGVDRWNSLISPVQTGTHRGSWGSEDSDHGHTLIPKTCDSRKNNPLHCHGNTKSIFVWFKGTPLPKYNLWMCSQSWQCTRTILVKMHRSAQLVVYAKASSWLSECLHLLNVIQCFVNEIHWNLFFKLTLHRYTTTTLSDSIILNSYRTDVLTSLVSVQSLHIYYH
jgi:hypothetical protein